VRIVADEVRGEPAQKAADVLRFHPSKGAFHLRKVINSAIANAQENNGVSPENLRIATIMVDEGPRMKRILPRSMGRANRILKKTSHITVIVEEFEPGAKVKPHGTKAKSRPKFEAPKAKKAKAAPVEEAVAPVEEAVSPVEEVVEETAPVEAEAVPEVATEAAPEAETEVATETAEDAAPAEEPKEGDA
jgi:large subunit ribosomal protein L22